MRETIILAGGKFRRMKKNKALMKLHGKTLLSYVLEKVLDLNYKTIVVIGRNDNLINYSEIIPSNVLLVKDETDNIGPLSGILTGMQNVNSDYALVLPCDSPFIKKKVLKYLFRVSNGFDASIPRWPNGYMEPLHAVYQVTKTIEATRLAIKNKEFFLRSMINRLKKVNYIDIKRIKKIDPNLFTFFNINSQVDFDEAEKLIF